MLENMQMHREEDIALVFITAQCFSTCRIMTTTKHFSSEWFSWPNQQAVQVNHVSIHQSSQSILASTPIKLLQRCSPGSWVTYKS